MAGLDLPIKLRRGLGQGNVVPAEELAKRLAAFDADKDGAVTRQELIQFLVKNHVGGPWFCEVLSRTLWKYVEQRLQKEQPVIRLDILGRIMNFAMSRPARPEGRYEITPEGMAGYKPLVPLKKKAEPRKADDGAARPRAAAAPGAPRAPAQVPARGQSAMPGRTGAPAAPAAGARPRTAVAAPARPTAVPRRPGPGPRR